MIFNFLRLENIQIKHIKECNFRNDPEKVIKECLEFLND